MVRDNDPRFIRVLLSFLVYGAGWEVKRTSRVLFVMT